MPRKAKNNTVIPPSANPLAVCNALRIPPATYFAAMAKFAQTIQTATSEFDRLAGTDSQRQSALRAHVASQIGTLLNGSESTEAAPRSNKPKAKVGRKPKAEKPVAKPKAKVGRKPKAASTESAAGGTAGRKPNGPDGKGVKQIVSEILQNASMPMGTDAIEGLVRERYDNAGIKVPDSISGQIGTALSALRRSGDISAESAGQGLRKNYAWSGAAVGA
jgi:hypothetical protein